MRFQSNYYLAALILTSPYTKATTALKPFQVTVTTDDKPEEISWELRNICSDRIELRGGSSTYTNSHTMYVLENLISEDFLYNFTIFDAGHDGLCCDYGYGSFMVKYDGSDILKGREFDESRSIVFGRECGNDSSTQGVDEATAPTISPRNKPESTIEDPLLTKDSSKNSSSDELVETPSETIHENTIRAEINGNYEPSSAPSESHVSSSLRGIQTPSDDPSVTSTTTTATIDTPSQQTQMPPTVDNDDSSFQGPNDLLIVGAGISFIALVSLTVYRKRNSRGTEVVSQEDEEDSRSVTSRTTTSSVRCSENNDDIIIWNNPCRHNREAGACYYCNS